MVTPNDKDCAPKQCLVLHMAGTCSLCFRCLKHSAARQKKKHFASAGSRDLLKTTLHRQIWRCQKPQCLESNVKNSPLRRPSANQRGFGFLLSLCHPTFHTPNPSMGQDVKSSGDLAGGSGVTHLCQHRKIGIWRQPVKPGLTKGEVTRSKSNYSTISLTTGIE